jgi:hypothetical protein
MVAQTDARGKRLNVRRDRGRVPRMTRLILLCPLPLLLACSTDRPSPIGGGETSTVGDGDGDPGDGDGDAPCDEDSGPPLPPDLPEPLIACSYQFPFMFITRAFGCPDETTFYCEEGEFVDGGLSLLCCDEIEAEAECHWETVGGLGEPPACDPGMVEFCKIW